MTNAREVQQNGRGRKGDRETTNGPGSGTQSALVTATWSRGADAREADVSKLSFKNVKGEMRPCGRWPWWRKQLRSAVGERKVERRRSGAFSEVESERNDADEPQTEAGACAVN